MTQRLAPDAALVERFRKDLGALWSPPGDARLLVAVSGGPDSMALLLLAHAALGGGCVAATVDHALRHESAAEAAMVAGVCARIGVPHAILTSELPERVGGSANLSARARAMRYRLLEQHMAAVGAERLATAHHADDQLETMVMRLNRGAGIAGLAGVRARTGHILRPLLAWRRVELVDLVRALDLTTVDDPSNADDRFDRARLRKELAGAPWLDAAMWQRSAAALGDAEEALDWAVRREAERRCAVDALGISLLFGHDRLPWELARRLFRHVLRLAAPAAEPRGEELTRLVTQMLDRREHGSCATLGGVRVEAVDTPLEGLIIRFRSAPPPRVH